VCECVWEVCYCVCVRECVVETSFDVLVLVGPSSAMLCSLAKEHGMWLVGGSIPEKHIGAATEPEIYNTVSLHSKIYVSRLITLMLN
jgi:hypothetical protein